MKKTYTDTTYLPKVTVSTSYGSKSAQKVPAMGPFHVPQFSSPFAQYHKAKVKTAGFRANVPSGAKHLYSGVQRFTDNKV